MASHVNHVQRELDSATAAAELIRKRHHADDITAALVGRIVDALQHADRGLALLNMELDYRERGRL
jgi:hypothetical protein